MGFSGLMRTLIIFAVAAFGTTVDANPGDDSGHIFVYPEESIVQLDDTFSVYVAIDTVFDVKSFLVDIEIDTSVVKVISAIREPFFNGPSGAFFFWTDTTHVFSGTQPTYVYELLASLFGPLVSVDGPGYLFRMTCVAVGHGVTGVFFRQTEILDRLNARIALDDSLSGMIIVCPTTYRFGDADFDTMLNISDAVYLINYIFASGPAPRPIRLTGDANCDAVVNISDVVYIINYIFAGGQAPCNPCD